MVRGGPPRTGEEGEAARTGPARAGEGTRARTVGPAAKDGRSDSTARPSGRPPGAPRRAPPPGLNDLGPRPGPRGDGRTSWVHTGAAPTPHHERKGERAGKDCVVPSYVGGGQERSRRRRARDRALRPPLGLRPAPPSPSGDSGAGTIGKLWWRSERAQTPLSRRDEHVLVDLRLEDLPAENGTRSPWGLC